MCIYIIENKKFFFEINKINIQKILYILIIYILINFLINKFYFNLNVSSLRSLFYFRFIILFLIILHVTNKDNFNYAFTVSSAILILLSFDIIFQYYIGYNIIGFKLLVIDLPVFLEMNLGQAHLYPNLQFQFAFFVLKNKI